MDSIIDLMMLLLLFVGIVFSGYAMWDSQQLTQEATAQHYQQYRPTGNDSLSFTQLRELNPDVFGWLTIYGTNIDYPLVQGEDNLAYVNTGVTGEDVLSGSIFLDYRNQKNFSDFNSIIYGHHMDKQVMFGEIGYFGNREYFEEHQYGNLYFKDNDYGLEFFAFLEIDAYDSDIYIPAIKGELDRQKYLDNLINQAIHLRDIEVSISDHLVLLSTCTSDITNGRHILVGKLSATVYENPYNNNDQDKWSFGKNDLLEKLSHMPRYFWMIMLLVIGTLLFILTRKFRHK